jgi:hypothetical protein
LRYENETIEALRMKVIKIPIGECKMPTEKEIKGRPKIETLSEWMF